MSGGEGEIRREFEVSIPEDATPAEEERLIEEATDREEEKLLDELEDKFFRDAGL
ncbi:hypothetical protein [Streptomyces sp. AC495_CC817]|uniref:hypothetical protein n=1 Tax=Streptomyces sp. AC495_CC817 TaxID=2823900 RepID=UPI001C271C64|nr:hypothetical protein [Streptomyces sp. AC495_CC817]